MTAGNVDQELAGGGSARSQWESLCNRMRWGEYEQTIHLEGFLEERGLMVAFLTYAKKAAAEEAQVHEAVQRGAAGGEEVTIVYDFEGEVSSALEGATKNEIEPQAMDMNVIVKGVAQRLEVRYPRGDRYGVAVEASQQGGERWAKDMGFVLAPDFEVWGEDSGDDSTIQMSLTVLVPAGWKKAPLTA